MAGAELLAALLRWAAWLREGLPWSAAVFSVLALLTILSACSSGSLGERAARPVLPSLTRAAVNGVPGVWMDERDAGALALWIEEVSP